MNEALKQNHSSESERGTRAKVKDWKKTVGITLPQSLVERARKRNLNISRITEQALNSILDYQETQNQQTSSVFLSEDSFQKESSVVPRAGFEPATTRSSASPSLQRQ
jgi:post-segregation antitoxin (ccd killing protein)